MYVAVTAVSPGGGKWGEVRWGCRLRGGPEGRWRAGAGRAAGLALPRLQAGLTRLFAD